MRHWPLHRRNWHHGARRRLEKGGGEGGEGGLGGEGGG